MKIKYFLLMGLILGLILIAYIFNRKTDTDGQSENIKIAAIINLTGPPSQFDAIKKRTIELAMEKAKLKFNIDNIDLLLLDAGGSPEITKVAIKKALDWNCDVILSGTSPTGLAIAKEVREQKRSIIQIGNAANPAFGLPYKYEYRFWPDWNQEVAVISRVCDTTKYKNVLLVYSADPYSEALATAFKGNNKGLAITEFKFDPSAATDFRPYLIKAKEGGVEAVIIFGLPPGIKSLISQLTDISWNGDLIGGVNISLTVKDFNEAKLPGTLWVLKTEAMDDTLQPGTEAAAFRSAYKNKYNENPPFHSLYLADAIYWIAKCSLKGKDSLLFETNRVNLFNGPSGTVKINPDATISLNIRAEKLQGK